MIAIHEVAKRWALGLVSEGSRINPAEGNTRRARRAFSPTVDGLPARITPSVMILPADEPEYNGDPYTY